MHRSSRCAPRQPVFDESVLNDFTDRKIYISRVRTYLYGRYGESLITSVWLWPPAHTVNRFAGDRIDAGAADRKVLLFVEADGARVVGVDVEIKAGWRKPPGFPDETRPDLRSPQLRRHYNLVEIESTRINRDETDNFVFILRDYNVGVRH
jgi:hypothetical protein